MKRIALLFVLFISIISISFAHSGRTDSNGGHYNRSTGEYHYHHGYSAHQHPNGVCPYESNNQTVETTEEPLKVNDYNTKYINTLNERISNLEKLIDTKDSKIRDLNERIIEKNKEIEEIKSEQEGFSYILGFIIICLIVYIFIKRKKNKSQKSTKQ